VRMYVRFSDEPYTRSEGIRVWTCSWYHVRRKGTGDVDIRGSEITTGDRIWMRGVWGLVTRIKGRKHGE